MGVYSEYMGMQLSFDQLCAERKRQLERISKIRNRPVIVYASDLSKNSPNSIDYSDPLPFSDQLSNLHGDAIDVILETPGGIAEVVEDLVKIVRSKFYRVGVIIPGTAKSAGTIFTMAADEILMCPTSSLGPIDAQILSNGKRYSADAFLEGLKKIRLDAERNRRLDIAYIPILQNISPGEIQHCENAQNLSRTLVTNWLKEYKFKFWETHKSTGNAVTNEEKEIRAKEIASLLCTQGHWLTHGRSIKINDLRGMRLDITNYSENHELDDAITRYYTLLQMSFETNIYKIYETASTQIYKMQSTETRQMPSPANQLPQSTVIVNFTCNKCKATHQIQADLDRPAELAPGTIPFPKNNIYRCPNCDAESNILVIRQELEAQTGKRIV